MRDRLATQADADAAHLAGIGDVITGRVTEPASGVPAGRHTGHPSQAAVGAYRPA
ncbi:hypothetical protein O7622_15530 [Micromonospora sp. WMMD1076]|uniref:hypothetical protein n=1 Tax=Micromonospora sp. WMMD1076 TaxID=3016103 RepID=UPI00249B5AC7|nr:hypothetical protein [Micromonospora sp. WMMD1076]WFF04499.1 hypothetical protein O7622_15530 [Micromonospora sp. WMMD1076]